MLRTPVGVDRPRMVPVVHQGARVLGMLALVACSGGTSTDRPAAEVPSALRIVITSDAKLYADGQAVTLTTLDSLLTALKAANGEVWYYREPRDPILTAQQDSLVNSILAAITRHELSVRVSRRPDFSDQGGKRRRPGPGRP
ncbi:MAG: hypothetical protein ACREA0_33170 [bacterium]